MTSRHPHRPLWAKVPAAFTAASLAGHSAVGLAFGALIYLVCLTGTISVLVDELKLIEQPRPSAGVLQSGALNRAVAAALRQTPRASSLYATAPITPRQRLTIVAFDANGEHSFISDGAGRIRAAHTPFTDFVTNLHMTLATPAPWGSLIVGLTGATLLSLILSGLLSHPRIFRDAFRLRFGGSERLREADLHNRLSVWALPFHLIVTLTGAFFALANLTVLAIAALGFHGDTGRVYQPLFGPAVPSDPRPAKLPDLEALVLRARTTIPGSSLYYVGLDRPGTRGARIAVEITAPKRLPRGEDLYFNGAGDEIGRGRFVSGSLGLQAYSAAAQLHFGFFGGLPVRLIYVGLGAALTFISASGITIWLARSQDRGRPKPRLRRAWRGWTWGTSTALILAAVGARILPAPLIFWSAVVAAQALAQTSWGDVFGKCSALKNEQQLNRADRFSFIRKPPQ